MSLEQLSFLAQIISAIVVVASLIFVGYQLKHAAAAIRVASSQAHLECYTDLAKSVIDSDEFARIWRIGLTEPKSLMEDEWVRFVAYANALFRLYEISMVQRTNGRLDEEHWRTVEQQVAEFWPMPGLQAAWKVRGQGFSANFRHWFENYMPKGATPPYRFGWKADIRTANNLTRQVARLPSL